MLMFGCGAAEQHSPDTSDLNQVKSQLMDEYSDLFDGSLGKYKYGKISLALKDDVQP